MPAEISPTHDGSCTTSGRRHRRDCPGCRWVKLEYDRERCGEERRVQIREYDRARYSDPEGMRRARSAAKVTNARYASRSHKEADADFTRLRGATKVCPVCRKSGPASAFFRTTSEPDGRSRRCRKCHTEHYAARRWAALARHWRRSGVNPECCVYCERPIRLHDRAVEHFIPVARGGGDEASNLLPACPPCNSSKGKKEPWGWLAVNHPERIEALKGIMH